MKTLYQGAEAILTLNNNLVTKNRIAKGYRIKELDEKLRKLRTRGEARILERLKNKINVPKVLSLDEKNKKIELEYIEGDKLADVLDNLKNKEEISKLIGIETARMHDENIIHSDLTTSNMILKEGKVFFIDFGLSYHSTRIEDKAVDIHLLKQALEAKHFKHYQVLFKTFLEGYKESKDSTKVLKQLELVEKRGRYKH